MPQPERKVPLTEEQKELMESCWPMAIRLAGDSWRRLRRAVPLGHADSAAERERRDYLMDAAIEALAYSASVFKTSRGAKFSTLAFNKISWRLSTAVERFRYRGWRHLGDNTWDLAGRDDAVSVELREWCDEAFGVLEGRDREIMELMFRDGLGVREVGRRLGVTDTRIGQVRDRAVAQIRERLGVEPECPMGQKGKRMKRKKVYVAGPITKGDQLRNIAEAIAVADKLLAEGFVPFCPHAMSAQWHMHFPKTHEQWIDYDLEWVEACDALYRIPGESVGADLEVAHAREKGIPVVFSLKELVMHFEEKEAA